MQDYHQLEIWQRAMSYAVEISRFSAQFPDAERYNLTSQLDVRVDATARHTSGRTSGVTVDCN